MLTWMKNRRSTLHNQAERDRDAPTVRRPVMSGAYLPLFKYLDGRYANALILTFAEIEDLLDFRLPAQARLREDWWTIPDPNEARPRYSDSWILANRTARPNLQALTVAFDRQS